MPSLLVRDALAQSWGNPDPTNQMILKPARLSRRNGVKRQLSYAWNVYKLPNTDSRFHVYQIGQIHPQLLNLFDLEVYEWTLLSEAVNNTNVMVDLYTSIGIQLPRTRSWFRWVDGKNIFIAVEINSRINVPWPDLEVWLRLYKNSYFETDMAGPNERVEIAGGLMANSQAITTLRNAGLAIENDEDYNGGMSYFINGIRRSSLSLSVASAGDVVEYVYDTTIYKVVEFPVTQLPSFVSTLDAKSKGVLHYAQAESDHFDFVDHIDLYLHDVISGRGAYIHKNAADTLRQLTHKDYALALDYLPAYYPTFRNSNGQVDLNVLRIRMHVRLGGQALVPHLDANMSRYLMEMPDANQSQAMVGVNATFPLWQAAALEASAYMQLMRSNYTQITTDLVQRAYGYYRVNKILGDSILPVVELEDPETNEMVKSVTVPYAFRAAGTAYEYDADGLLLGVFTMANNILTYFPDEPDCATVEFVEGVGGKSIEEFYGSAPVPLSALQSYRFYIKVAVEGGPAQWQDVTGTGHYRIENGVAYWADNTITTSLDRLVRSDKKFLKYDVQFLLSDATLVHQINYDKITTKGTINSPLQVPMGELDVWLNGHPLIKGIDYLLNFPILSVVNKEFLIQPEDPEDASYQTLELRMTGFCDPQLKLTPIEEVGFVYNGVLSTNARHDMHMEKVLRISVNGALKRVSEVHFVEEGEDVQETELPIEGKPFQIRDMVNRLNGFLTQEAYAHYRLTRANEQLAESYLSQRVPQEIASPISPIVNKYEVFSPFLAKIIHDLLQEDDYIDLTEFEEPYSDSLVRSLCVPYLHLLQSDPIGPGNLPDQRYCAIHPHPWNYTVLLPLVKFRFFQRVVKVYAHDQINYNALVAIG